MPITPDTKDWTWVLQRPCPECGLDVRQLGRAALVAQLRDSAAAWEDFLARPRAAERPTPDVWSALEYGCHVRDVYRLFAARLALMLDQDAPTFPNWDQDQTAVKDGYDQQDATAVARELRDAAESLADGYGSLSEEQWERRGSRSDGAVFTVESFGRYLLHDIVHHVDDVRRGFVGLSA
jgi:hypothetical protein